ncbi:MAG: CheR family methyltransferase [Methylomonas sp.]
MRNHRIQDIEIELLLLAMKERWGYDFSGYARASLKRRLDQLVSYFALDSLSQLMHDILYDDRVAQTVINAISVPTSEFFRDPSAWQYVRTELLPRLASFPLLNIWQVGCGRGQETYTLAILLHETGLSKKARVTATDINSDFLEEAQQGRWSARDLDHWRENYIKAGGKADFDQYFKNHGTEIAIIESLKSMIKFVPHNLVCDDVFLETQFIVCRNVLIYFGPALQERVIDVFVRSLQRGGFLMLGFAESLSEQPSELEIFHEYLHIYQKPIWRAHG